MAFEHFPHEIEAIGIDISSMSWHGGFSLPPYSLEHRA